MESRRGFSVRFIDRQLDQTRRAKVKLDKDITEFRRDNKQTISYHNCIYGRYLDPAFSYAEKKIL